MSTDTPRPERMTLTEEEREEIWQGLRRIRPADPDAPPVSLLHRHDRDHALWAVSPAVEGILAAREQALREEDPTREQVARYLERQSKAAGVPQVAGMYAIEWAHAIRGGAR